MLWYAAYGSNLALDRLMRYLEGGKPAGSSWKAPGARDRNPPSDVRPWRLTGQVYFAWNSPSWGGGIALWAPGCPGADEPTPVHARAYRLTTEQFSDLAAQEMHQQPGTDLDLAPLLETGSHSFGPGHYQTMHVVGEIDEEPVLTFTAPETARDDLELNAPTDPYLTVMGRGLCAAHGWSSARAADYLMACAGISANRKSPRDPASVQTLLAA